MPEQSDVFFLWTESPLHAGGDSTTGLIDNPIQRERSTGFPIIRDSSLKGALRDHCRRTWERNKDADAAEKVNRLFGPEKAEYKGAVHVSEARLLLFPVRSLRGVTAWITCPKALSRFAQVTQTSALEVPGISALIEPGKLLVTSRSNISFQTTWDNQSKVVLEENTFSASNSDFCNKAAQILKKHSIPKNIPPYGYLSGKICSQKKPDDPPKSSIAILSDEDFQYFVNLSTDVSQRIRIDIETGVVADTGLWTEENLPTDCLLYFSSHYNSPPNTSINNETIAEEFRVTLAQAPVLQIGGDATLGRGLTRAHQLNIDAEPESQDA